MKSRGLTYLLLVVVLIVWGVIACKLFFAKSEPEMAEMVGSRPRTEEIGSDTLWLNYSDPFLTENQPPVDVRLPSNATPPSFIPRPPEPPKEQLTWTCTGRIKRNKDHYYLLDVSGIQHALREGDTLQGFTLHRAYPDSLCLTKAGERYIVRFQ